MKRFLVIFLLLVVLGVIVVLGIKTTMPGSLPVEIKIITTPTTITDNGPVILKAIRNQATLETVTMVLANDQDITKVWGLQGACRESLTYLGYFTVTAGVDLQNIAGKDVIFAGNGVPSQTAVTLILPPANILHVELDTQRSRVIHSDVSILSQLCGTQLPAMVLEAQSNMRVSAEASAREQNIIKLAQDRASFELQKVLQLLGYNNVTVQFNEANSEQPY